MDICGTSITLPVIMLVLFQRATLNDFDRFKLMRAKQMRNRIVKAELGKLKKAARKAAAK